MESNHPMGRAVAVARFADELTTTLLGLGAATRGRCERHVAQLRKDVRRGRRTPFDAVLVLVADAVERRGASRDDVLLFAQQFAAICEALAAPDPAAPADLHAAIDLALQDETLAEGAANCAELELAHDKSPATMRRTHRELTHHRRKLDRPIALLERALYTPHVAAR